LHQHRFRDRGHADHLGWRCWGGGIRTQQWPDDRLRPAPPSDWRRWDRSGERVHGHYREVTKV
jgi:hypothetical protein